MSSSFTDAYERELQRRHEYRVAEPLSPGRPLCALRHAVAAIRDARRERSAARGGRGLAEQVDGAVHLRQRGGQGADRADRPRDQE